MVSTGVRVYRFMEPDAEDVAQAAIIKALGVDPTWNVEGYARQIFTNMARDFIRRKGRRVPEVLDSQSLDTRGAFGTISVGDQGFLDVEESIVVSEALEMLPPKQRAALELRATGHSIDEIASIFGIRPISVRTRIHRARETFRVAGFCR